MRMPKWSQRCTMGPSEDHGPLAVPGVSVVVPASVVKGSQSMRLTQAGNGEKSGIVLGKGTSTTPSASWIQKGKGKLGGKGSGGEWWARVSLLHTSSIFPFHSKEVPGRWQLGQLSGMEGSIWYTNSLGNLQPTFVQWDPQSTLISHPCPSLTKWRSRKQMVVTFSIGCHQNGM